MVALAAMAAGACGGDDDGIGDVAADAATAESVDASTPDTPDAAAPDAGNPALDAQCTPGFDLEVTDDDPARRQIFFDAVGEDPAPYVQDIGRRVCRILYREADEVRDATHLTLIIEYDPDGVAWKAGNGANIQVGISTAHLQNIHNAGGDVAREITGILFHEMTHMYQHDDSDGGGVDLGLIEGIADFVRISAGYPPPGAQPNPNGNWNDGYRTTAFFLLWLDDTYPDFVYRLNLTMHSDDGQTWSPASFEDLTGKTVDALWQDYRDSF